MVVTQLLETEDLIHELGLEAEFARAEMHALYSDRKVRRRFVRSLFVQVEIQGMEVA